MHVTEGSILAGKYRTERVLGRGGMGMVVAAEHVQLEQKVAIKLLLPEILSNQEIVQRFLREARASARIQNEHVVRVFDVGTLETGEPYMAMELLEGQDLGDVIASRGRLGSVDAVDYVLEACEALAEAHGLGIVHRDIKPSNLFLARRSDGSTLIKVLDFGISKTTGPQDGAMTRTSALLGSPLYMSPEQLTSARDVDARSDIWALGIVLYELLSGEPPFVAQTLPQIIALVMSGSVMPLRERVPSVPEALAAVVHRCLEKDPEHRYANLGELASELAPFASTGHPSLDRVVRRFSNTHPPSSAKRSEPAVAAISASGGSTPTLAETKSTWAGTLNQGSRKHGKLVPWLIAGATLAVALGTLAFAVLGREDDPSATTSPSAKSSASVSQLSGSKPESAPVDQAQPQALAPATEPAARAAASAAGSPPEAQPSPAKPTKTVARTPKAMSPVIDSKPQEALAPQVPQAQTPQAPSPPPPSSTPTRRSRL